MSKKIYVQFFGDFEIDIDGKLFNIDDLLGKQLSSLLALFVYNHSKTISKDTLIDIMWKNSGNPVSALKYAIHRIRNEIKDIDGLNEYEWIITSRAGYSLNPDVQEILDSDVEEFNRLISVAKNDRQIEYVEAALTLYKDRFLAHMDAEWIAPIREFYESNYFKAITSLCEALIEKRRYSEVIEFSENALIQDELNEDIIFIYLKALIEDRQYNKALKNYEYYSKKFYEDMQVTLHSKIQGLFSGESSDVTVDEADAKLFIEGLGLEEINKGPLVCDNVTFKKFFLLQQRTAKRSNKITSICLLELSGKVNEINTSMQALMEIVISSIRGSDVVTKIGSKQAVVLMEVNNAQDVYVMVDRISRKFYRKIDRNNVRLHYYVYDGNEIGNNN